MTTRIPIQADPGSAVEAFWRISQAIDKASQAGKKFADIDFSHPELKQLEGDLATIQRNFEQLSRVNGSASAATLRGHPDAASYVRARGSGGGGAEGPVDRHLVRGTRFEPVPMATGGRPRSPREEEEGATRRRRGLAGVPFGGLIKGALGLAGLTSMYGILSGGISGATSEAISIDTLKRSITDTSASFSDLRKETRQAAKGLQVTYQETARLAQSFAQTADDQSGAHIAAGVRTSVGVARAFGLQPTNVGQQFARAEWLKAGVDTDGNMRRFAGMIADAVGAGNMWGRAGEVIKDLNNFVASQERVSMNSPNVQAYLGLSSAMNASGIPGLRGEAGQAVINRVNSAIEHGGNAGVAGRTAMWMALTHGGMGPFRAQYLEETGMFGSPLQAFGQRYKGGAHAGELVPGQNLSDVSNFLNIRNWLAGHFGSRYMRYAAGGKLLGISMHAYQALSHLSENSSQFGRFQRYMSAYNIPYKHVNASGFKELAHIAYSSPHELSAEKAAMLQRTDLSASESHALESASSTSAIRREMMMIVARHGQRGTVGSQTRQASATLANASTRLGSTLLPALNDIKAGVGKFLGKNVAEINSSVHGILKHLNGDKDNHPVADAQTRLNRGFMGDNWWSWSPTYMLWNNLMKVGGSAGSRHAAALQTPVGNPNYYQGAHHAHGAHSQHTVRNQLDLHVHVDHGNSTHHISLPETSFSTPTAQGSG